MTATASPFQANPYLQGILMAADDEACIKVRLNGVALFLPAGTILTMAHCLHLVGGGLELVVEASHLEWMRAKLRPGSVFLDVGSATGAMTLPIAAAYPGVRIIAFEPARRARRLLKAALIRNDLHGATVIASAVSDQVGTVAFAEHPVSEDGSVPFLPETSTIVREGAHDPYGASVEVPVTTLDTIAAQFGVGGDRVVVKIDIEGFEVEALRGAAALLRDNTVFLAIDIHQTPGGAGTTAAACRQILQSHGYSRQEMMGHVLLASKPGES